MARALIVGCGCRGRGLGRRLLEQGWSVRGTSRRAAVRREIEGAGIEPAEADPDRLATVLEHVGDVAAIVWLMGSASDGSAAVAAVNGDRLESLMARLVDTPVRGFVYEAAGSAPQDVLERGAALVEQAWERWHIPVRIVRADPGDPASWTAGMAAAVESLL